jgi:hypothetical protein
MTTTHTAANAATTVMGLNPTLLRRPGYCKRSRRLTALNSVKHNDIVRKLRALTTEIDATRSNKAQLHLLRKIYTLLAGDYIDMFHLLPFCSIKKSWCRLLTAADGKLDFLLPRMDEKWINAPRSTKVSVLRVMRLYRKRFQDIQAKYYYMVWLIRQMLPLGINSRVIEYYGY